MIFIIIINLAKNNNKYIHMNSVNLFIFIIKNNYNNNQTAAANKRINTSTQDMWQ